VVPIFERQLLHLVLLAMLLVGVRLLVNVDADLVSGSFLGLGAGVWLTLALAVPVLHQLYVAFAWRTELHRGLWSRRFGDRAFALYKAGFTVLIVARPLSLLALAIANRETLPISPVVAWVCGLACLLPPAYLGYSIRRYFTMDRAYGIDHFNASYRGAPLVRRGIFRWSPNAMYVFGFLALWGIALLFRSRGALLAAGFQHLYIWVHYLCTERPDMRRIYGGS
jgi:protein-S-isoprenylcysteine O-methyltransferase Ste14